jgi:hypothetical protein
LEFHWNPLRNSGILKLGICGKDDAKASSWPIDGYRVAVDWRA